MSLPSSSGYITIDTQTSCKMLFLTHINTVGHTVFQQEMESQIELMPQTYRIGPLMFLTDQLKRALLTETKQWKLMYGRRVNEKCGKDMDEILQFCDTMKKRLNRPVRDLDDIRTHMTALNEIRENEIRIDIMIIPIDSAYSMLNKYNLSFNDGNAERVDTLPYRWKLLKQQVLSSWYCPHGTDFMVLSSWYCPHGTVLMVLSSWYCPHGTVLMVLSS